MSRPYETQSHIFTPFAKQTSALVCVSQDGLNEDKGLCCVTDHAEVQRNSKKAASRAILSGTSNATRRND